MRSLDPKVGIKRFHIEQRVVISNYPGRHRSRIYPFSSPRDAYPETVQAVLHLMKNISMIQVARSMQYSEEFFESIIDIVRHHLSGK